MPSSGISSVAATGRLSATVSVLHLGSSPRPDRRSPFMISALRGGSQGRFVASTRPRSPCMDEIDHRIVALLRENARRSFQDIGSRVSLSAPAVKRRVDRLERERGHPRLLGERRPGGDRLEHPRLRRALLRGPDVGRGGPRRGRRAPRGRGRLHDRRRAERDPARARRRHPAPRAGAGADPRDPGRDPHADPGRALDPVRAPDARPTRT